MLDFIVFLIFMAILYGIVAFVVNFPLIALGLVVLGVIIYFAAIFMPEPSPGKKLTKTRREAEKEIRRTGKEYRKRVKDILD